MVLRQISMKADTHTHTRSHIQLPPGLLLLERIVRDCCYPDPRFPHSNRKTGRRLLICKSSAFSRHILCLYCHERERETHAAVAPEKSVGRESWSRGSAQEACPLTPSGQFFSNSAALLSIPHSFRTGFPSWTYYSLALDDDIIIIIGKSGSSQHAGRHFCLFSFGCKAGFAKAVSRAGELSLVALGTDASP